jgi:AraC-like DNA-binding protein
LAVNRLDEHRQWMSLTRKQKRGIVHLKENVTIKDGRAYSESGEDVTHMVEVVLRTPPERKKGKQTIEELAKHEESNGGFVFAFFNACKTMEEAFPNFSQPDLARIMFIGTYTGWDNGVLKHDNGVLITKKTLQELLDMSRNKFADFYKQLIADEVVAEQDGQIFINPAYFYRGENVKPFAKSLGLQYTRLFRSTVRELYQQHKGRGLKHLALVYALLPFVNFNYNVICFNPDEKNAELVRPMNIKELAALLGYSDEAKFASSVKKVKLGGQPVFGVVAINGKSKQIIVNPNVVYAGDGKSLDAIKILFR